MASPSMAPTVWFKDKKPAALIEMSLVSLFIITWALLPVPSTVIPVLFIAMLSLWLRSKRWRDMGLFVPKNWLMVAVIGIIIGIVATAINIGVVTPFLIKISGAAIGLSSVAFIKGNIFNFVVALVFIWMFAAVAEEMVYRGYVLNRITDMAGQNSCGYAVAITIGAILFGIAHARLDIASMAGIFLAGTFNGLLYIANKRNLLLPIIVHGTMDSIVLILLFLGMLF